ncbi:MAG TPA: biotin-dependent carboxyltransferase family protein [Jatrophihabitans sp.]|nr:biotin-dependent carboxyltransferase family protein [Jatrophihabitans sp.]
MIEIIAPGPLATLQDLGRTGYADLGVGRSGAADRQAHQLANRLVGNRPAAASIEITLGGLEIRLLVAATVACAGARCPGVPAWHSALSLPAGSRLRLGSPATGLRSYLAVRGGFAVPPVLGSRSTDTLSGLGPAPLRAGDRLPIGTDVDGPPGDPAILAERSDRPVRLLPGPRVDWFTEPAFQQLLTARWRVLPASDRIGIRLDGPVLARRRDGELPSEPTLPGALQVPPDGRPIVLGPDAPVTGGYPVIAMLGNGELDRVAQLRPGQQLRFEPATRPRPDRT